MDNEKQNGQDTGNDWLDELLASPDTGDEIGADEHAVSAHGMSHLSDMELEKIMQEAMSDDWDLDAILASEALDESEPENTSYEGDSPAEPAPAAVYSDDGIPPEDEEEENGVPRKVRPKRKKGYGAFGLPHLASVAIWIMLAVFIGFSLGRLIWVCAADVLAFGRQDQNVTVTIEESDTLDTITQKLYDAGLIKYQSLFKMYAKLSKVEEKEKISVGTFELNTLYDYHALVAGMSASSSYRVTIDVTIPEGYTCAQIFALLEEKGVCTAAELESYAMESDFADYWFLEDVEKGTKYCLEGFLFPDTYNFYTNSTAKQVFIKMLGRFESQFDEELQAQIEELNNRIAAKYKANGLSQTYIDQHKLTIKEIVTIASMIEKESAHTGEIRDISSVIYNRLTNPGNYPKLNIDATVVYALGGKADLTEEDLKVDSPYNTYLYEGLPPGPISNPGMFSLKAALNPTDTGYYFYALDPTAEVRGHRFFKTYQEHMNFLKSLE